MRASADIRHKRADAGLVKTAHHLVEQGKESVPETLRRELCMSVLASSLRHGRGVVVSLSLSLSLSLSHLLSLSALSLLLTKFALLNPNLESFYFYHGILT